MLNYLKNLFIKKNYSICIVYKYGDMNRPAIEQVGYIKASNGDKAIEIFKKLLNKKKICTGSAVRYHEKLAKEEMNGLFEYLCIEFKFDN